MLNTDRGVQRSARGGEADVGRTSPEDRVWTRSGHQKAFPRSAALIAQLFDSVLASVQSEEVLSLAPLERLEAAAREAKL